MADDGTHSIGSSTTARSVHEYERGLLGAVLQGGRHAVDDAIGALVKAADFSRAQHRVIWDAVVSVHARGDEVDPLTTLGELTTTGKITEAGGASGIASLDSAGVTGAGVVHYARLVRDEAAMRRITEAAVEIRRAAVERDGTAAEVLALAQQTFLNLNQRAQEAASPYADRVSILKDLLERRGKAPEGTLSTTFADVDEKLGGGLRPGNLVVIAGRPSMGKSAFAHAIAARIADKLGVPAAMYSLEMSGPELLERELIMRSDIPRSRWSTATRDEESRLAKAAGMLEQRPLFVVDRGCMPVTEVCAHTRRLHARHGVGVIVVDYLGLLAPTGRYEGNRAMEVAEQTKTLKAFAADMKMPVILVSQLNRESEKRNDKRPTMADLRDSGSIEQDANVVMLLHRPEYYKPDDESLRGKAEIIVAKNRNGPTGTVEMHFKRETMRFSSLERDRT